MEDKKAKKTNTKKVATKKTTPIKAKAVKEVVEKSKTKVKKVETKRAATKKQVENRFSLFTVIILLFLIFIPLILITADMKYTYFRDNLFAQDFFNSDTSINELAVIVGCREEEDSTNDVILDNKQKSEMLKLLSDLKVRKQKLVQTKSDLGIYVDKNHTYIRIVNLKTDKVIKIKVEGSLMEVQGYTYVVDDTLKTAEINNFIDNILTNNEIPNVYVNIKQ